MVASAIYRRLRENGGDGVLLLCRKAGRGRRPTPADLAVVAAAVKQANDVVPEGTVAAQESVIPSPTGVVVNLDWVDRKALTDRWLAAFGQNLAGQGWSGSVTAAPQAHWPQWLQEIHTPNLTVYAAYHAAPELWGQWGVDPNTTRELCREAVRWGTLEGADIYFSSGTVQVLLADPDVSHQLEAMLLLAGRAGFAYMRRMPLQVRWLRFDWRGEAVWLIHDPSRPWIERLAAVRSRLLVVPEQLDVAFVRLRRATWATSWLDLDAADPSFPFVDPMDLLRHRHLWAQHVPDAHGAQLLTRAHLDRATDLGGWDVTTVGKDRFLVQSRDLDAWYAGDRPDEDVLRAARRDFGDMILTSNHLPIRWAVLGGRGYHRDKVGVGDIILGISREQVRQRCASLEPTPDYQGTIADRFPTLGLTTSYDQRGLVNRIDVTAPAEPSVLGLPVFGPLAEIMAQLRAGGIHVRETSTGAELPDHDCRLIAEDGVATTISF